MMAATLCPLPSPLLFHSSVAVAPSASAPWSPGVAIAHCDHCTVTLLAGAGAPVTVAGDYDTGWTITRTGAGKTVLDLKVGDFKVGEVSVTEAAVTPDTTPDTTPNPPVDTTESGYLETTVDVKGQQQRLRVYNPNKVDLTGAQLVAEAVTAHENLDDTHEIEHLPSYNISLLDANDNPLKIPLSDKVELCFEVLDGLDRAELEVVLAQQFADGEFEEELVEIDGATWGKVKTDHFIPYDLIDNLTDAEKVARNVPTGDLATRLAVAGLGVTLVLALGIMLRLITNKRKFEE